jgi:hypothetical protein
MLRRVLLPCDDMWGRCKVISSDPDISQVSNVLYLPFKQNATWGIFDREGAMVPECVDRHGPNGNTPGQMFTPSADELRCDAIAPASTYIYGGTISLHYGHFLVNTLARYWPLLRSAPGRWKVLCHGPGNANTWFERPFLQAAFNALGLAREDFVSFEAPTRIPQLVVPHTSFCEQHHVHRVYADLCNKIGLNILGATRITPNARPAYLSKTAMTSGVGRVINEDEIVSVLEQGGVEIIFPEKLHIREQVKLFAERLTILGVTGSAFHTSILHPAYARLICLSPTAGPNSNFFLMDRANGSHASYFYAPGTHVVNEGKEHFLTSLKVENTAAIAQDLLDIARDASAR